ncbi:hypothetical protein [Aquidulcibacter sp.]|uniref:hypothetical protein n=1 Tax=Aquidulcibacter sp. TaxID=2052990 RepID=UPI0028A7BA4F|nr:hypothetical protein [Aquidulcibacter sp.]
MNWRPFALGGKVFDLSHLDEFAFDLIVPAKQDKPEQVYRLNVTFSIHCFTRSARKDEAIEPTLAYSDSRETRIFDFERYQQSKRLREIVESLMDRKCHHDQHGNFYVFEVEDAAGVKSYYSVFFTVSKAGRKAGLNLYVTTAHLRSQPPYAKNVKPVRFSVIVHNVWRAKGLKPAP